MSDVSFKVKKFFSSKVYKGFIEITVDVLQERLNKNECNYFK